MGPPQHPYKPYAAVHADPHGPGDARPTGLEIIEDEKANGALRSTTILITGCSSGLGVETARALYETGAQLFLTARDIPKLNGVIDNIVAKGSVQDAPRPQTLELHLESLESVKRAAEEFKSRSPTLNILIANAGIMGCQYSKTVDGFERQFATNHLAHFLLFHQLNPLLLSSAASSGSASRVIIVSSAGHRFCEVTLNDPNFDNREYDKMMSYGQSKTANVWMANALDRRYGSQNLHAVSLHPGPFVTELGRHLTQEDLGAIRQGPNAANLYKTPEQGAATTVWAAVAKRFESYGGVYLSGVGEAEPFEEGMGLLSETYAPHIYSEAKEERLWKLSAEMVGVSGN